MTSHNHTEASVLITHVLRGSTRGAQCWNMPCCLWGGGVGWWCSVAVAAIRHLAHIRHCSPRNSGGAGAPELTKICRYRVITILPGAACPRKRWWRKNRKSGHWQTHGCARGVLARSVGAEPRSRCTTRDKGMGSAERGGGGGGGGRGALRRPWRFGRDYRAASRG